MVRALQARGLPAHFGDGENADFLDSLPVRQASWVITTLPQWDSNRALLHALRGAGHTGHVAGCARDALHAHALAEAGVHPVFNPFDDAADHAARQLFPLIPRQGVS